QPTPVWLLLFVAIFSYGGFYLVKVHPVLFSAALTMYVVFLIAFTGLPETSITGHRLLLTALGSLLALASRAVGYHMFLRIFRQEPAGPLAELHR
ncbi:MAG TPA: FUSC family protein, partial [Candidatus Methylacidiphilales bacterium]